MCSLCEPCWSLEMFPNFVLNLGLFKTWHPSNILTNHFANFVNLIIIFAVYNFVALFVYRYCQTVGNRFLEFLSSRKCFILHIGNMCLVLLLVIPTNAADEEEMREYKDHMDPVLRELVKDYAFYGLRVKYKKFNRPNLGGVRWGHRDFPYSPP